MELFPFSSVFEPLFAEKGQRCSWESFSGFEQPVRKKFIQRLNRSLSIPDHACIDSSPSVNNTVTNSGYIPVPIGNRIFLSQLLLSPRLSGKNGIQLVHHQSGYRFLLLSPRLSFEEMLGSFVWR